MQAVVWVHAAATPGESVLTCKMRTRSSCACAKKPQKGWVGKLSMPSRAEADIGHGTLLAFKTSYFGTPNVYKVCVSL